MLNYGKMTRQWSNGRQFGSWEVHRLSLARGIAYTIPARRTLEKPGSGNSAVRLA